MLFLNYNGKILDESAPILTANNRGLRFGDGFFESMAMFKGKVVALDFHLDRILTTARMLALQLPADFSRSFLQQQLDALSFANRISNARVRLQFFREGAGLYKPEINNASFIITQQELGYAAYQSYDGVEVVKFDTYHKPLHGLSALKSSNALLYILAARYAADMDAQDSLIVNEHGNICEASGANIFAVLDGKLITPPISEGCVDGVMSRVVIQVAVDMQLAVSEAAITDSTLEFATEVFLTNAARGIVPVAKYGSKEYEVQLSKKILKALNQAVTDGKFG